MGRHRSDPMGIARVLLAGVAVLALLALLVLGVRALLAALNGDTSARATPSTAPTSRSPEPSGALVPTVLIECRTGRCGGVFVRVPGGDILLDRELSAGERAVFTDERLDVVLDDAEAVRVEVNGTPREPEKEGREAFTVTRAAE